MIKKDTLVMVFKKAVKEYKDVKIKWNEKDLKPLIIDNLFCDICERSFPHLIVGEYKGYDIIRCFNCRVLSAIHTESEIVITR